VPDDEQDERGDHPERQRRHDGEPQYETRYALGAAAGLPACRAPPRSRRQAAYLDDSLDESSDPSPDEPSDPSPDEPSDPLPDEPFDPLPPPLPRRGRPGVETETLPTGVESDTVTVGVDAGDVLAASPVGTDAVTVAVTPVDDEAPGALASTPALTVAPALEPVLTPASALTAALPVTPPLPLPSFVEPTETPTAPLTWTLEVSVEDPAATLTVPPDFPVPSASEVMATVLTAELRSSPFPPATAAPLAGSLTAVEVVTTALELEPALKASLAVSVSVVITPFLVPADRAAGELDAAIADRLTTGLCVPDVSAGVPTALRCVDVSRAVGAGVSRALRSGRLDRWRGLPPRSPTAPVVVGAVAGERPVTTAGMFRRTDVAPLDGLPTPDEAFTASRAAASSPDVNSIPSRVVAEL
jgi:hypothetical protein